MSLIQSPRRPHWSYRNRKASSSSSLKVNICVNFIRHCLVKLSCTGHDFFSSTRVLVWIPSHECSSTCVFRYLPSQPHGEERCRRSEVPWQCWVIGNIDVICDCEIHIPRMASALSTQVSLMIWLWLKINGPQNERSSTRYDMHIV